MDSPIARAYDAWSAIYDTNANPTRDLDAAVLRMQPFALTGSHVVEIGCGTGKNTAWLAAHAARVDALDFSRAMLAVARENVAVSHVSFVEHDVATPWPLASARADLVTCNLVLEHIDDLAPVFVEAARVLRSGGTLFVSELHPCRQLLGKQARFTSPDDGREIRVDAFRHDVSAFIRAAFVAGLVLTDLAEPRDRDAADDAMPRLLLLTFAKS